eukprot:6040772-Prymnesium_polylepis.1
MPREATEFMAGDAWGACFSLSVPRKFLPGYVLISLLVLRPASLGYTRVHVLTLFTPTSEHEA